MFGDPQPAAGPVATRRPSNPAVQLSFFESPWVAKTRPLCCSLNAFVQKLHTY